MQRRNVTKTDTPTSVNLQGYVPLYVNATAGTTVYGAFDPIQEIADLCEKYNLWLHVDVSATAHRRLSLFWCWGGQLS